ncbi:MAG: hypothetical protein AB7E79_00705 [Rhodospirillaceae bacterium]
MREAAIVGILGILLPAWIMFGLADWYFHRRSGIAQTSGWRESLLHLFLTGQAGFGVLLALFFDVTTLVAAILIIVYLAHELTTGADVTWATPRRNVVAHEQRVHDYLTAIPFAALFATIVVHPAAWQWLADDTSPDWGLRLREDLPPLWYLALFLLGSSVNALAYLEEFVRCWKARV